MSILPLGAAAQVMLLQSQIATNALLLGIPGGFATSDKPPPTGRKAILNAMGWGKMVLVTLSLALALVIGAIYATLHGYYVFSLPIMVMASTSFMFTYLPLDIFIKSHASLIRFTPAVKKYEKISEKGSMALLALMCGQGVLILTYAGYAPSTDTIILGALYTLSGGLIWLMMKTLAD